MQRPSAAGWGPTTDCVAGQPVEELTAPDNGQRAFAPTVWATTAANGGWSDAACGPARLVEAAYPGAATVEPPCLTRSARRSRQGDAAGITPARLPGGGRCGCVASWSAAICRRAARWCACGSRRLDPDHIRGARARHRQRPLLDDLHFGAGVPGVHRSFWFEFASLPMGNYPFAPAHSRR